MKEKVFTLAVGLFMSATSYSQNSKLTESELLVKASTGDVEAMEKLADKYNSGMEYMRGSSLYTVTYKDRALAWYLKAEEA